MSDETWKALFIKADTHQKVKLLAVRNRMTLDEVINFLLDRK